MMGEKLEKGMTERRQERKKKVSGIARADDQHRKL